MYVTNTKLVQMLGEYTTDTNSLIHCLISIQHLTIKYGKKIFLPKSREAIHQIDNVLGDIITLLINTGKTKIQDIKDIIRELKQHNPQYDHQISIESRTEHDALSSVVSKQFTNAHVNTSSSDELRIKIAGEWWYYHRSLDSDLTKLLQ